MTVPGIVMLSKRAVGRLVLAQSILTGLQVVAAASVLGDVIGGKYAALFIVLVAGAQQGVNTYISKSAAETVDHVTTALSKVETAVADAKDATATAYTAAGHVEGVQAIVQQTQKGGPDG